MRPDDDQVGYEGCRRLLGGHKRNGFSEFSLGLETDGSHSHSKVRAALAIHGLWRRRDYIRAISRISRRAFINALRLLMLCVSSDITALFAGPDHHVPVYYVSVSAGEISA